MRRPTALAGAITLVIGLTAAAPAQLQLPGDLDFRWSGTVRPPGTSDPIEWQTLLGGEPPEFIPDSQPPAYIFPNLHIPENIKNLWILVTWADVQSVPPGVAGQFLVDAPPPSAVNLESVQGNMGLLALSNQFLIHWTIDPQPDFEFIEFLDLTWTSIEIGTKCVPTPGALALVSIAGLAATRRRR